MILPQIETHKNRCDGRVFSKTDVTVYCHPDSKAPVLRESIFRTLSFNYN